MPKPKPITRLGDERTNIFIWLIAIICAILATAVIIAGIVIFAIYLIYQPKMPYLVVTSAHLNKLDYDQSGLLDTEIALNILAENDNKKAHATISDLIMRIAFHGIELAELRADPFEVEKNSSVPLNYVVPSAPVPLDESGMDTMDASLKEDLVRFDLEGQARTRWRIGIFLSVKFWTHLSCAIKFFPSNGSTMGLDCSSKSG